MLLVPFSLHIITRMLKLYDMRLFRLLVKSVEISPRIHHMPYNKCASQALQNVLL